MNPLIVAMEAGIDGFVCSPLEAAAVRARAGPRAILVTPGVRSAGAGKGGQKRVATPVEASRNRAEDPAGEADRVLEEIR